MCGAFVINEGSFSIERIASGSSSNSLFWIFILRGIIRVKVRAIEWLAGLKV